MLLERIDRAVRELHLVKQAPVAAVDDRYAMLDDVEGHLMIASALHKPRELTPDDAIPFLFGALQYEQIGSMKNTAREVSLNSSSTT